MLLAHTEKFALLALGTMLVVAVVIIARDLRNGDRR